MGISAIETAYGGYRFRSRLEARWAVFLDAAEIRWRYEPEGLRITLGTGRLRGALPGISWLPDFELPDTGQLAEVKGSLDSAGQARLLIAASEVARCGPGRDIVVLGHIQRRDSGLWPAQLHSHGGLWAVPWDLMTGCPLEQPRPRLALHGLPEGVVRDFLLEGIPGCPEPSWASGALDRARGARFEHGESG